MAMVKMNHLTKHHTLQIQIKLTRQFHFRLWVAIRLLRLAAWMLGCGIQVNSDIGDETECLYKND